MTTYTSTINLVDIIFSHFGHFFIGPGFNSTFPLIINDNAIIKAVASRLHTTFKSLHVYTLFTIYIIFTYFTYYYYYYYFKFSSFTHLRPTIRGQKQPKEDLHCSTEIMVKREIRNSQLRSTS